jgi:hypothetical protein
LNPSEETPALRIIDRSNSAKAPVDLKHKLPHRRGRIDRLLVQVEVDADRLKALDRAE